MSSKPISAAEPHELRQLVAELQARLKKRNEDLTRARRRLNRAKERIQKLESIVSYQRGRIIELHT